MEAKDYLSFSNQSGGESAYDNPKYDLMSNGFATHELCELSKN